MIKYLLLFFSIFQGVLLQAQALDSLIEEMASYNKVHTKRIGRCGTKSIQYHRYERMLELATTEELIRLSKHKNNAVKSYVGWALVERDYHKVDELFKEYLKTKKKVKMQRGCIAGEESLAEILYSKYSYHLSRQAQKDSTLISNDLQLFKMDSTILYSKTVDWFLIYRALDNRIYSKEFLPPIKEWAFKRKNLDAITYIFNHHLEGNEKSVQKALIQYLGKKEIWNEEYEFIFETLLSFKQDHLNKVVLKKYKHLVKKEGLEPDNTYNNILIKYGVKKE